MNEEPQISVEVLEPERANLLGLMMGSLLERRLHDADAVAVAKRLRGEVLIDVQGMRAALRFGENRIEIAREPAGRPVAELRGNLPALLGAAVGRGTAKNVIGRQLRFSGNLRVLWRLMALMRATP